MKRSWNTRRARRATALVLSFGAVICALLAPAPAAAVTQVYPDPGAHLEWLQVRPIVAFDVPQGETPKWVLISTDHEMKNTVRYCRQFVSVTYKEAYHWGCNAWAIGADMYGQDVLKPLQWNTTYYWQVVYTKNDVETRGAVREFTIDEQPDTPDPTEVSDQIWDSIFGDGTNLNLGAAAFSNSGLKTPTTKIRRKTRYRFMIDVTFTGGADLTHSYVRIKSKAGTRYLPLHAVSATKATATWPLSKSERRLKRKQYTYQAFLKSTKNHVMVRSAPRVVLIKKKQSPPKWTPNS